MDTVLKNQEGTWREMLRPPHLLPLVTLGLGVALFAFNIFFVITALPTAVSSLDGLAFITWASSLYLIFAITTGAAAGLAKARFGARPVFLAATTFFAIGTVLTGIAPDMPALLVGRALQGAGAGMVEGLSYAMIPVLFPQRLVPKVFGVEAMMWVLAAFGGPAIAGFLTSHWSWRMAMLTSLPLALIFISLVLRIVPKEKPIKMRVSFPALRLGAIAAGLLLVTLSSVASAYQALFFNIAAVVAIMIGFVLDRSAPSRLFPLAAFTRAAPLGIGFWVIVLMAIPESSVSAFLPYSVQKAWGYSPTIAGAVHSVLAFGWSFSQLGVATYVSQRWRRELIWIGSLLLALGLLTASAAVQTLSLPLVIVAQLTIGIAFGINWGSISQLLMEAAPEDERGLASALLPTAQSGGFALGASLCGLVGNELGFASAHSVHDLQGVVSKVLVIAGVFAFLAVPFALRTVRSNHD